MNVSVDVTSSEGIPGWMTPAELTWLAEQASQHNRIVEIGSFLGRSTKTLAQHTPGIVFAVDTWLGSPELTKVFFKHGGPQGVWDSFIENTKELLGTKIIPIGAFSTTAAAMFAYNVFDMIFIDASHDSASLTQDIKVWSQLLVNGGLLCGHDYGEAAFEVHDVVDKLLPDRQLVPGTSIWFDIVTRT